MDIYYIVLVVWCVFESVLCSAVVFGWAQLLEILENERYFVSFCRPEDFSNNTAPQLNISNSLQNEVGSGTINTCSKQDSLLRLAYTLSVFGSFASIFVSGKYLDVAGFRKTRILACSIYLVAGVMMFISTYDLHELLFPGLILTVTGGGCYISVLVKVCGVLPQRRYTAMSIINGGIDSSSVVLLIFKLCYNAGISFKFIIIVYYSFAVGQGLLFTFTVFPKDLHDKSKESGNGKSNEKRSTSSDTSRESLKPGTSGKSRIENVFPESGETKKDELEIFQKEEKDDNLYAARKSENAGNINFLAITRSTKFLVHTCFVCISSLRSFTFIGMINTLLKRLTDDHQKVDLYLTILGLIQFSGIVISFLPGFLLDWYPTGRHRNFSTILSVIFTGLISIFVTVGVLIPVLKLQILIFVLYAMLRSFLYSTHGSFVMKEFPLHHIGALFGLTLLISAVVSLFQIPMFALMEGPYNGNPTWVNVGLLVFQILVLIHPIYLWKCTKKRTENPGIVC